MGSCMPTFRAQAPGRQGSCLSLLKARALGTPVWLLESQHQTFSWNKSSFKPLGGRGGWRMGMPRAAGRRQHLPLGSLPLPHWDRRRAAWPRPGPALPFTPPPRPFTPPLPVASPSLAQEPSASGSLDLGAAVPRPRGERGYYLRKRPGLLRSKSAAASLGRRRHRCLSLSCSPRCTQLAAPGFGCPATSTVKCSPASSAPGLAVGVVVPPRAAPSSSLARAA